MLAVRCTDERMLKLQRSGRIGFVGTAKGIEARSSARPTRCGRRIGCGRACAKAARR
jgi:TPP-dependent pyruvate/acetoin dehydrogenase alpha subunit